MEALLHESASTCRTSLPIPGGRCVDRVDVGIRKAEGRRRFSTPDSVDAGGGPEWSEAIH